MVLRQRSFPRTYEVGRRIAVGGMGEVYEGFARDLERRIAVKRMLKSDSTPDLQELFLREVAVCATLEHPNVVEVLDAGVFDQDLYLIMEFVDGPSLAELVQATLRRGNRMPVEVTCGIIAQVARGLAHAHERSLPDGASLGIVHRDVAAENVLLSRTGLPKLVDFGLATLSGHTLTTPGTIRGRPRALSPEQARGEKIDVRTDIFALGAMMFELAAGQQLYPDDTIAKMLWKVVEGDYEPIAPRLEGIDPDLVKIIQTAIEVDQRSRFRSAREMERSLDKFRAARGMRIESGLIASLINKAWPDVMKARERKKDGGPGELEGSAVVLDADRLDTSTSNFQVPAFIAERGRQQRAATDPSPPPQSRGPRPQSRMASDNTPSKPRPSSTVYSSDEVPSLRTVQQSTTPDLPNDEAGPELRSLHPLGGPTPESTMPFAHDRSAQRFGRSDQSVDPLSSTESQSALRAGLRAEVGDVEISAPRSISADSEIPKPATPARSTRPPDSEQSGGRERAWLVFLGIVLIMALITFVSVWLDDVAQPSPGAEASKTE